jgi:hypothetical protein
MACNNHFGRCISDQTEGRPCTSIELFDAIMVVQGSSARSCFGRNVPIVPGTYWPAMPKRMSREKLRQRRDESCF